MLCVRAWVPQRMHVLSVRHIGAGGAAPVTEIVAAFDNGKIIKYEAGQFAWWKVPRASAYQWHPITISSSPAYT
jgi:predicted ferric reductase